MPCRGQVFVLRILLGSPQNHRVVYSTGMPGLIIGIVCLLSRPGDHLRFYSCGSVTMFVELPSEIMRCLETLK
jgi:hypothetical protein